MINESSPLEKGNKLVMKKKIVAGIISGALVVSGGVALANSSYFSKPVKAPEQAEVNSTDLQPENTYGKLTLANGEYEGEIKDGLAHGQGTVYYWNGDHYVGSFLYGRESGKGIITQIVENGERLTQEMEHPILTAVPATPQGKGHRVPEPNDGLYRVRKDRPTGIVIHAITFHEGFRGEGMKAVDIHIMARSHNNENELVQGRDGIVSITGSTGKVYSMIGTKRTGVNTNAMFDDFQEQEITQYQDISVNEKEITSIVVRRDGKLITIQPDEDTKTATTHP